MSSVALGFRAHSGWAVVVTVAGSPLAPVVLHRQRVELVDSGLPKQPYHAAEPLELKKAEALVNRSVAGARRLARQALRAAVASLNAGGHEAVACGILLSSGRPLTTLAATLTSHALIHTAEGELFREALTNASEECKLPVKGVKERELWDRAAAEFGVPADELQRRITELGRSLGPPWRQDEKHAALVGWLALKTADTLGRP